MPFPSLTKDQAWQKVHYRMALASDALNHEAVSIFIHIQL